MPHPPLCSTGLSGNTKVHGSLETIVLIEALNVLAKSQVFSNIIEDEEIGYFTLLPLPESGRYPLGCSTEKDLWLRVK